MFKRLNVPPKLRPVWVQQQYAKEDAILRSQSVEGNTVWLLTYSSMVDPGSPPPPEHLLRDPIYLQMLQ